MDVDIRPPLPGDRLGGGQIAPQDILHHRGSHQPRLFQRHPQQVARQFAELVGRAPLDRPVPAVVRARRHFVEIDLVALDEILDRKDAPITALLHETPALAHDPVAQRVRNLRRHDRQIQNSVAVDVAPHGKADRLAAVADHDGACLEIEGYELLDDTRPAEIGFDLRHILLRTQHDLPVTVVTQRAGLEDAGEAARLADGRFERRAAVGRCETRRAQAVRDGVALLAQAILRVVEGLEALRNIVSLHERNEHFARDVFEFIGHHVAAAAQLFERRPVVVGRHDMPVGHTCGGSIGRRIERHHPRPLLVRLLGEHQPQLTRADHTDRLHRRTHPTTPLSTRRPSAASGTHRAVRPPPRRTRPRSTRRSARRSSLR